MEVKAQLKSFNTALFLAFNFMCACGATLAWHSPVMAATPGSGVLVAVGGGSEDPALIREILDLAKGKASKVAIVNTASSEPAKSGPIYLKFFQTLGVPGATLVPLLTREQAYEPAVLEQLSAADLIYFTGGNQIRLAQILAETPAHGAILAAWQRGAVIAGTSAGAMVWGPEYLAAGTSAGALLKGTSKDGGLDLKPGLGLLPGVVVDTHFGREGRLGRLLVASAQQPGLAGVGVDERTAALITAEGVRVIGDGHVTVVDLEKATYPAHQGTGFSVRDASLHLLSAGDTLRWHRDESEHRPMLPPRNREPMALGSLWLQGGEEPPKWTGSGRPGVPGTVDTGLLFGRLPEEILILCGDGATAVAQRWQAALQASGRTTVRVLPAGQLSAVQLQRYLPIAGGIVLVDDANASLARALGGDQGRLVRQAANHLALAAVGGAVPIPGETAVRPGSTTGELFPGLRVAPNLLPTQDMWTPGSFDRLVVDALLSGGSLGIGLGGANGVKVSGGSLRVAGEGPVILLETDKVSLANPAGPSARDLIMHVLGPGEEISL
ncbi:MAG: cyanophycinase [Cyanobacteria bacterium RYN_339]|nr:cyanophycinase [Cyanobacteria bacterium RYN_339]